jgi:hypothetical protein
MPRAIKIVNMHTKVRDIENATVVNTTARSGLWSDLSPFKLGPCDLYGGRVSVNVENAWQYAKLYACHADEEGNPTDAYWRWAEEGWANPRAVRYPMGRGARPLCSLWNGQRLGYIEARKQIYGPLYAAAVTRTEGWRALQRVYQEEGVLVLRDYDGYDHAALGMSLGEVLNNPTRKMGHAFVLAMLLAQDEALQELVPGA